MNCFLMTTKTKMRCQRQSDRDAMNVWVEVSEPSMDDSNMCEQCQMEDCDTSAEEPGVRLGGLNYR